MRCFGLRNEHRRQRDLIWQAPEIGINKLDDSIKYYGANVSCDRRSRELMRHQVIEHLW